MKLSEQGVARVRLESPVISRRVAAAVDQPIDMGLRLPAPGSEQAVALFVALGAPMGGQVAQAPAVDDLEPVLAAGVEYVEVQVDRAAELLQQPDVQRRNRRQREDVDAAGQPGRLGCARATSLEGRNEGGHRVQRAQGQLAVDTPPQRRLPTFVSTRSVLLRAQVSGLLLQPGFEPVGAVGDVLLQQPGHPARELVAHDIVRALHIRRQAGVPDHECGVAERGVNAPGQHRRRKRRLLGHAGHKTAYLSPQPPCEEVELNVGADTVLVGDRQGQRTAKGRAGYDEMVRGKHAGSARAQTVEQQLGERFVAVGEVDVEHEDGSGGLFVNRSSAASTVHWWPASLARSRVFPGHRGSVCLSVLAERLTG